MGDILKAGLDKLKPNVEEFYEKGYIDGYEVAEEELKVLASCSACGKAHLPVVGDGMKAVAAQRLFGWSARSYR